MSTQKEFGFRSSVGGYHKGEVNAYIARLAQDIAKQNEERDMERAQHQRELQHIREEIRKNEKLREELTCQYLDALSKIDQMMEHLAAEQQKNEELMAEKANNVQRMEQLEMFDMTKEALAKAKISLSLEQKRVAILQKEKENLTARLSNLEASLANSKDAITSKLRDNKTLSAENDALKARLDAMDMIIASSKEIIATEKQRTEAWNAKTDALYEQIAGLEKELAKYKDKQTTSTSAFNDMKSNLGNARAALNQAKQALAAEQNKNAALIQEKTMLASEISHLKNTVEQTRAKMAEQITAEQAAAKAASEEILAAERAKNAELATANEALTAELASVKTASEESLAAERAKNAELATANEAMTAKLTTAKAELENEKTNSKAVQKHNAKIAALEAALAEKSAELLAVQAEIEKLRGDLVYQNRMERVAYAHTNTFFIKEEKMGRFYRDAIYGSEQKIGI